MNEIFWLGCLLSALLGGAFGSFSAMAISRKPKSYRDLLTSSKCNSCFRSIAWYENIPVLAWLLLKGKCSQCKASIPSQTFFIELSTCLGFIAIWLSANDNLLEVVFLDLLFALCIAVAAWDFETKRIPNLAVSIGILLAYGYPVAFDFIDGQTSLALQSLISSLIYSGLLGLIHLAKPHGMGLGDVKLALVLGALAGWYGYGTLAVAMFAAFAFGAIAGLLLIGLGKATRKSKVPFGPWMVTGVWFAVFFGDAIWGFYLQLIASVVS